jgi:hypothetical protein
MSASAAVSLRTRTNPASGTLAARSSFGAAPARPCSFAVRRPARAAGVVVMAAAPTQARHMQRVLLSHRSRCMPLEQASAFPECIAESGAGGAGGARA